MESLSPLVDPDFSEYAAVEAWKRLGIGRRETLQAGVVAETPKTLVCRLSGVGVNPSGIIIAKRTATDVIEFETTMYGQVLPKLPIRSLRYYGTVTDTDPTLSWLFLEDAGDDPYSSDNPDHCILGAQWLGLVHGCSETSSIVHLLPEYGPKWYFQQGREACERILQSRENTSLTDAERETLDIVLTEMETIFSRQAEVDELCQRMPRTLVHGDFFPKNLRIRQDDGKLNLFPLDWETAGYAVPAADVAYHIDLDTYFAIVGSAWPKISFNSVKQLARCGRVFRMMVAVEWASYGLGNPWPARQMRQMRTYRVWLAELIQEMGW